MSAWKKIDHDPRYVVMGRTVADEDFYLRAYRDLHTGAVWWTQYTNETLKPVTGVQSLTEAMEAADYWAHERGLG